MCHDGQKVKRNKVALADSWKANKWLADQLGKDPATVSKWCTNVSQPSLETLLIISKLLGVEVNVLVRPEAVLDHSV